MLIITRVMLQSWVMFLVLLKTVMNCTVTFGIHSVAIARQLIETHKRNEFDIQLQCSSLKLT